MAASRASRTVSRPGRPPPGPWPPRTPSRSGRRRPSWCSPPAPQVEQHDLVLGQRGVLARLGLVVRIGRVGPEPDDRLRGELEPPGLHRRHHPRLQRRLGEPRPPLRDRPRQFAPRDVRQHLGRVPVVRRFRRRLHRAANRVTSERRGHHRAAQPVISSDHAGRAPGRGRAPRPPARSPSPPCGPSRPTRARRAAPPTAHTAAPGPGNPSSGCSSILCATATGSPSFGSRTKSRRVPIPPSPSTRPATGLSPWKSKSSQPSAPAASRPSAS